MLGWLRHLNAHQRIALFYLAINLPIFGILTADAFDPKIRHTFELLALSITAVIVIAPYCLRFAPVNKLFGWTNALTTEEKTAIFSFQHFNCRRKRFSQDFSERIKPFFFNISVCGIVLLLGIAPLLSDTIFSSLCGALGLYLCAVSFTITAAVFAFAPNQRGRTNF